ncbi:unnamed protein product [Eruca vesicaria subsp. sativa]|uniref:Uncharacterized protein n=1 Tax=Eruca vesicaria subsp. sativa TaxID=29727 RepID=A0ABC8M5K0_ERUVS|nr:unnamed protein product [Eruca vesicaria subsp. sativa]
MRFMNWYYAWWWISASYIELLIYSEVLIVDKLTVKIMSCACKMADILDERVSLVEDIFKRRQPLPSLDAIYFIQPTKEKEFVFLSSPVSKELVGHIKKDLSVLPRIGALRERWWRAFNEGFVEDGSSIEQIDKLSLHVEIARKINDLIREQGLREIGQLEQDLVFGDAGMKDVIKFLSTVDAKKNTPGGFTLKFDLHKKTRAVRKERQEEAAWQLSRFYPMIEELVEKLGKGELPKEDYPCMNDPSPSFDGSTSHSSSASSSQGQAGQSMRSRRTPTWAKSRGSDDGYSR